MQTGDGDGEPHVVDVLRARLHAEGPGAPSRRRAGRAALSDRGKAVRFDGDDVRREWFEKDYYQVLGVAKNASAGRDQEGVPQARPAATTPTRTLGTPTPRSGSRRSPPPTTCSETRTSASATTRSARWARPGSADPAVAGCGPGAGGGPAGGVRYEEVPFDLGDLFGGMFGGRGGMGGRGRGGARSAVRRGADLETDVTVSFDDAMTGTTVPVRITGPAPCRTCHGTGAKPGHEPGHVPPCGGSGAGRREPGVLPMAQTCPDVSRRRPHRSRRLARRAAAPAAERRTRTLQVKIPAGVKDGARIKLAGPRRAWARGRSAGRPLRAGARATTPRSSGARATI